MSQLDSIGASFDRLSGREQVMVLFLVAAILSMVIGMSWFFIDRDLTKREKRINGKVAKLEELAGLRGNYQRRLSEQRRLAAEIKRNNSTRLLSYVEQISREADTQIKNAAERAGQPKGSLREVGVEVTVENVSIDRLYDFLERIERGNRLVKVRKLEVKTRFDNAKMLDAKVTVGTFKTVEG